jgi:hypothetical protein
METRAPSVEEQHTNLSFELPGRLTTRAYSFVAANAAIHEAWIRTSRASCGSDFGSLGWAMRTEVTVCRVINCELR